MILYGVIGAGGFGREVMPIVEDMLTSGSAARNVKTVFVVEYGEMTSVNGHEVMLLDEFLGLDGRKYFNIAIADSLARERIANKAIAHGALPFSIYARNSMLLSNNSIGEGAIICPFSMITSNVTVGRFFHANYYSYVAHDCRIGDFVTFAPDVHCSGRVIVEDHAYIGAGAMIKQGSNEKPIIIGRSSVVGMGAVVTKNVPPFATVVGNPAVVLRQK